MPEHGGEMQLEQGAWAWWLLAIVGVLSVAAGIILLAEPAIGLVTVGVTTGIFLLVDGITEVFMSLLRPSDQRALSVVLGVASAVVGILLVRHPIRGVVAVALLVGLWLIISGLVRFAWALNEEGRRRRLWTMVVAFVEFVAGVVIVSSPGIGVSTLALFVGISLILRGLALGGAAWFMRLVDA